MSVATALLTLAWIAIVLLSFAFAGLLRELRELRHAVAELGPAPRPGVVGRRLPRLAAPADGPARPTVLLVVNHGCGACRTALAALKEHAERATDRRLAVLAYDDSPDWHVSDRIDVVVDADLYRDLELPWTPGLLTLDETGTVTGAAGVATAGDVHDRMAAPGPAPAHSAAR